MDQDEILLDAVERMEKAVSILQGQLQGLRTGRATAGLVDSIRVDYYGSPAPLKQIAHISILDPQRAPRREQARRSGTKGQNPDRGRLRPDEGTSAGSNQEVRNQSQRHGRRQRKRGHERLVAGGPGFTRSSGQNQTPRPGPTR